MSTWHVVAIERLGAPAPYWPTIFGPEAGADPVAANGLRSLDLTPFLAPVGELSSQLDADLVKGSSSELQIDLQDADGSLAEALGPNGTIATSSRYYGPWIEVWERWGSSSSALRFRGYLDESSLQWSEADAVTQATVIHASQILRERLVSDFAELLRPWPSAQTNIATQDFTQSTADALLDAAVSTYSPRTDAVAIEAAQWALGRLSWTTGLSRVVTTEWIDVGGHLRPFTETQTFPAPDAPSQNLIIGGHSYAVDHIAWGIGASEDAADRSNTTSVATVYLQGAPDLTGIPHLGDNVVWGIPEYRRTHYVLAGGSTMIPAPADGSDGQKFIDLDTVEQLAPGDSLTLTFSDFSSGFQRTVTADLPTIIDVDGETGRVHFAEALSQGYLLVSKIRRNSQDPVLFGGLGYAEKLVAPFGLDVSEFASAPTDLPVLTWLPYDMAAPSLYGVHSIQTTAPGTIRAARRGSSDGSGGFPLAGAWSGVIDGSWAWLGAPTASATHEIFGDVNQWPGGANAFAAPVIYVEGDLSGGAATPPNGWRALWRTWRTLDDMIQGPESTWDGAAVLWVAHTALGALPARLVAFVAATPTPGRYIRTAGGSWTFAAHTADATLGTSTTPAISGTVPTGSWFAMGLGIWGTSGDDKEAILALYSDVSTFPFNQVGAILLSQATGGDLTVRQSATLWSGVGAAPGPWALGGGLVVQAYAVTIDGLSYPATTLHRLDGATVSSATFRTLEIIPQTIQPLRQVQIEGAWKVSGWYALALETYANADFALARRLRFLRLDSSLAIVNGDLEADPANPTDPTAYFRRGEVVASIVPDGSVIARMVRLSQTSDDMVGIFGGRLFQVAQSLPKTVERLAIGASVPAGQFSIAGSGDGMTASDYLEQLAGSQLASVVPTAAGGFRLVSRSAGTFQLRTFGASRVSVQASERGPKVRSEVWAGYIRKVRVTYSDILAGNTATVEVLSGQDGGRILELDHSAVLTSPTMARALGVAAAYWFGHPVASVQETWIDRTGGLPSDQAPTWWADWQVGDLVTFESTPTSTPTPVPAWKLMALQPGPESRQARVELRAMPSPILPE